MAWHPFARAREIYTSFHYPSEEEVKQTAVRIKQKHGAKQGALSESKAQALVEDITQEVFIMAATHAIGITGLEEDKKAKALDFAERIKTRMNQKAAFWQKGNDVQFGEFERQFKQDVPGLRGKLFLYFFKKSLNRLFPQVAEVIRN